MVLMRRFRSSAGVRAAAASIVSSLTLAIAAASPVSSDVPPVEGSPSNGCWVGGPPTLLYVPGVRIIFELAPGVHATFGPFHAWNENTAALGACTWTLAASRERC